MVNLFVNTAVKSEGIPSNYLTQKDVMPLAVEPYDKEWGVGISGCMVDPSPFPRVNRMLNWIKAQHPNINTRRGMIWTNVLMSNEDDPVIIKNAKAFKAVCERIDINIYPEELLVGEAGCPARQAALYPEFDIEFVLDEMLNESDELNIGEANKIEKMADRADDNFEWTPQVLEDVKYMVEKWRNKTLGDWVRSHRTEEESFGTAPYPVIATDNLYIWGGVGHHCIDWQKIMRLGYKGLLKEIDEAEAKMYLEDPFYGNRKNFYTAARISIEAATIYFRRYEKLAAKLASEETSPVRKAELERISLNLHNVATEPPKNFWEAMQLYILQYNLILIESSGHSVAFGRFDRIFEDIYNNSIASGDLTREFAQELTELFYIKIMGLNKMRPGRARLAGGGTFWGGTALLVGGVKEDGTDGTNDLSYIALDAHAHTRLPNPWMGVRLSKDAPRKFKVKVFNVIRIGTGEPKIYNDEGLIETMTRQGYPLEEARSCVPVGCVEPTIPGKQYGWHDFGYVNLPKVLQLAINDGICPECSPGCNHYTICQKNGGRYGAATGFLKDMKSIEEIRNAFDKQMEHWAGIISKHAIVNEKGHEAKKPLPFLANFFSPCVERGVPLESGGAYYNTVGPQGVGIGTAADCITTIKQLVFDEKKYAAEELVAAANANWKGYETMQAYINSDKVRHYGNDDDYADQEAVFVVDTFVKNISKQKIYRPGGHMIPGAYSIAQNVPLGLQIPATVDGRKANTPTSDCLGPVHNHDIGGPLAMANSVSKLNQMDIANGVILNWKFTPNTLVGETGRDNIISLIETYFECGGCQSQFNIVSRETLLEAQKHPENYKDLLVRVAGYSTYFVGLHEIVQNDLIGRTEYSFD